MSFLNSVENLTELNTKPSDRNKAFDGIRGYAALIVIVFHSILGFNMGFVSDSLFAPLLSIPDAYHIFVKFLISTFSGHTAVDIFFAMSGCVLIMSSQRCLKAGDIRGSVIFVIRRAFRIMPALLVCVSVIAAVFWALSFAFPGMITPYTKDQVFDNLMLWGMPIHGASWTLRVEMLAIPALAIVGLLYKKAGNAGLIFFLIFSILSFENPKLCLNYPDLSSSLIYFSLGAIIPT
ncbi:acyltransferase family protein [Nitrospirillum bahiense]|uniref:Acyltransferase-like protein n=1 Tax=Nitrospirillum amazonense TaxID=28077 RepID=A0A560F661_9PROT|nr:acyltransferase family protein [Nitrospirillum amazonense]TWB17107.1 acyltransferase-like protein [Nitrospirillum amazonense]